MLCISCDNTPFDDDAMLDGECELCQKEHTIVGMVLGGYRGIPKECFGHDGSGPSQKAIDAAIRHAKNWDGPNSVIGWTPERATGSVIVYTTNKSVYRFDSNGNPTSAAAMFAIA